MKLTTIRDIALTVASVAVTGAALEDIARRSRPGDRPSRLPAPYGRLYRLNGIGDDADRGTYVRPASREEANLAEAAEAAAGYPVFVVTSEGERFIPGEDGWDAALGSYGAQHFRLAA